MNNKKVTTLLILTIPLLTLTFGSVVQFAVSEPTALLAWSYESEGILVEVYAPSQAYPGDVVPISVKVNATAELRDVYVILWIFGSKYGNCTNWNSTSLEILYGAGLDSGEGVDERYDLEVPLDSDPGLVYGHMVCKWMSLDLQDHSKYDSLSITYLKNKAFEELQNKHEELQNKYQEINASYTDLKSKNQSEIGGTRNLMYLFVATTIVSAATVLILLLRRPKRLWT